MANDDKGYVARLREVEYAGRTFAHLTQTAYRRLDGFRANGLDRIDHNQFGLQFGSEVKDTFQRSLGADIEVLGIAG